jgi:uncharacterized membrane protein (UPF0127 family)
MRPFARLLLMFILVVSPAAATAQDDPRHRVVVETAGGGRHAFKVELALTSAEQARGLMWRESLPTGAGMLFLYDSPTRASFWMRNTLIPLDLIFIGADGRIVNIHANARPLDETAILSKSPVTGVLEINGGLAARLGIRPGDRVAHPAFPPTGQ